MNERYGQLIALRVEAEELAARFSLEMPDLPTVVRPAARKDAQAVVRIAVDAHLSDARPPLADRQRHSMIASSPGGEIIAAAGGFERPDFVLSPEELAARRAAEARQRETEEQRREQHERTARELAPIMEEASPDESLTRSRGRFASFLFGLALGAEATQGALPTRRPLYIAFQPSGPIGHGGGCYPMLMDAATSTTTISINPFPFKGRETYGRQD